MFRFKLLLAAAIVAATVVLVPTVQANTTTARFDKAFLTEMASHHSMAVHMGEMAAGKATHLELRRAGREIAQTQTAEIKQMQGWLKRWYGKQAKPRMTREDMEDMAELERARGAEFEVRFMAVMSVHHTQAIERARVAVRKARHAKVRQLARAIVKTQKREVKQFRDWLAAWYAN